MKTGKHRATGGHPTLVEPAGRRFSTRRGTTAATARENIAAMLMQFARFLAIVAAIALAWLMLFQMGGFIA